MERTEEQKKNILDRFEGMSREELCARLIEKSYQYETEKRCAEWLDVLADELRDEDDNEESNRLHTDYREYKERKRVELKTKYGI